MNYAFLRIFLPIHIIFLGFMTFVWRIIVFRRQTGKNPLIMGHTETPHGYVSRILKYIVAGMFLAIGIYSYSTVQYLWLIPLDWGTGVQMVGMVLLSLSFVIAFLGQAQMGASWRVGIETTEKTDLVRHGLYRFSRNPIYAGLYLANVGYLLVIPNVLTIVCFVTGHFALQTLVRLEEQHMIKMHGASYEQFLKSVRRWV